jgi:hypothetical protein
MSAINLATNPWLVSVSLGIRNREMRADAERFRWRDEAVEIFKRCLKNERAPRWAHFSPAPFYCRSHRFRQTLTQTKSMSLWQSTNQKTPT